MSGGDVFAFSALMIAIIAVAGIAYSAYETRLKHRTKELELRARIAEAQALGGKSEWADLEQRTRVLERIATDDKSRLANEIESLRDPASL